MPSQIHRLHFWAGDDHSQIQGVGRNICNHNNDSAVCTHKSSDIHPLQQPPPPITGSSFLRTTTCSEEAEAVYGDDELHTAPYKSRSPPGWTKTTLFLWMACFTAWVLYYFATELTVSNQIRSMLHLRQHQQDLMLGRTRLLLESPSSNTVQDVTTTARVNVPAGSTFANASRRRRPRFIMGIFGTYQDHHLRNTIRQALNLYNDSRLCSFGSRNDNATTISATSFPPDCQIGYTFVIGANPTGPIQILYPDTTNDTSSSKRLRQLTNTDPPALMIHSDEPNDVTLLNIQESKHYGYSFTWLHFGLQVMDAYQWGDYIIKCEARTGLRLDVFLDQTLPLLPRGGHDLDVYGGLMFISPTTGNMYMRGRFYMLSRHLAEQVVTTAAANASGTKQQKIDAVAVPEDIIMGISVLNLQQVIHWASLLPEGNSKTDVNSTTLACLKFPLRGIANYQQFIEDERKRLRAVR